jgi:hypothetical protein
MKVIQGNHYVIYLRRLEDSSELKGLKYETLKQTEKPKIFWLLTCCKRDEPNFSFKKKSRSEAKLRGTKQSIIRNTMEEVKNDFRKQFWTKLLIQNNPILEPQLLLVDETGKLFLGLELFVYLLDLSSGDCLFQKELSAYFIQFQRPESNYIIALGECELFVFDEKGTPLWSFSTSEILSQTLKKEDVLEITEVFGNTHRLNAYTGKEICQTDAYS